MKKIILPVLAASLQIASGQQVQWANKIINYSSQQGYEEYSGKQALGEPNSMPDKGYSATAWAPATDDRKEFLQAGFAKPMRIKQVIIAENNAPGAVYRVVLYDPLNNEYEVYKQKPDTTLHIKSRFLQIKMEETPYEVAAVKISLDCRAVAGINQVDAIGIADNLEEMKAEIKIAGNQDYLSQPERLNEHVNTPYEEVNPVISPDGKTLFFNRKNFPPHVNDDEIWYSELDSKNEWGPAKHFAEPINNKYHNFVASITPDGNTMLLNGQYFKEGSTGVGFSFSHRLQNGWSFPDNARVKNFINNDRYINFYLSNDGKKIFMNVRRSDTKGNSDLYVSFLLDDGSWSEPKTLGAEINTTGSECCAFLAADDVTLFYSSDGMNGFGNNDIYVSRRLDDTWQKWSAPLNIGLPVNSDGWDAYYTVPAKGDYAYFVRNGDIYRIRLKAEEKPKPVILAEGIVYNQKTKEFIPDATIRYEFLKDGTDAGIARTNPVNGEYKIILPYGHAYGFRAEAKGYVSVNDNLDATKLNEYTELKRDLYLVPVEKGQIIRLNNIFFDFAKSTLKEESFPELNRVVNFLLDNPTVTIEISGHTDAVGSENDNLVLSGNRAKSVMDYLAGKGILPSRLDYKGYGKSLPVTTNETEEGRAMNRRVEFKILHP
ncbi:MAG: OmpA family protein [Bacteroidetes bacterium]|nr:OmpA family protein [Bacteroidota bacterium]